jgi:hypothetical protein
MIRLRSALVASVLCMIPVVAQAEGFVTTDLGAAGDLDSCMFRAQRSLNFLAMEPRNGGATVYSGPWSVAVYDMQPGSVDVTIVCPLRDNQVPVALVLAHSDGPESERVAVVNYVVDRWNATGQARDPGAVGK